MSRVRDSFRGPRSAAATDGSRRRRDFCVGNGHVAEVDADAELDPVLWRRTLVAVGHCPLHFDGATRRVNRARELRQEAVAGVLYDPAPVLPNLRIDQLPEMGLEPFAGRLLIRADQPR